MSTFQWNEFTITFLQGLSCTSRRVLNRVKPLAPPADKSPSQKPGLMGGHLHSKNYKEACTGITSRGKLARLETSAERKTSQHRYGVYMSEIHYPEDHLRVPFSECFSAVATDQYNAWHRLLDACFSGCGGSHTVPVPSILIDVF